MSGKWMSISSLDIILNSMGEDLRKSSIIILKYKGNT